MDNSSIAAFPSLPAAVHELLEARPKARGAFNKQIAVITGKHVRSLREAAHLTQAQLAELVRTTQAHISDIERGVGKQGPSVGIIEAIRQACAKASHSEPEPEREPDRQDAEQGDLSLEAFVEQAVGGLAKGKLDAIADMLGAERSVTAVADAFVSLVKDRLPVMLMDGLLKSDPQAAVTMLGVVENLPHCSFMELHTEADLRKILVNRRSVVAVVA